MKFHNTITMGNGERVQVECEGGVNQQAVVEAAFGLVEFFRKCPVNATFTAEEICEIPEFRKIVVSL